MVCVFCFLIYNHSKQFYSYIYKKNIMDVQFGYINDDFVKNQYRLKINGVFYKCKNTKRDKFKHVSDFLYQRLVVYKILKVAKHIDMSKEALRDINYIGFIN